MKQLWSYLPNMYRRVSQNETNVLPTSRHHAENVKPAPLLHGDMYETVRTCDDMNVAARRPYADILLSDRAIYMDPWCAATVVAQLANHALSVLAHVSFLGAAAAAVQGEDPLPAFKRFALISLVLVTIPKTAAAYAGQRWQHAALKRYDQAFIASYFRRPRTWVMRQGSSVSENGAPAENQQAVRTSIFKERLRWGVTGMVDANCQLIDNAGMAVINGVFLGGAMGPQLTVAMLVAVGLTQGLGYANRSAKAAAKRRREDGYTAAFSEGLKVWDNLVLGNAVNRDPWLESMDRARHSWVEAGAREQTAQMKTAWLGALAAAAPMLLTSMQYARGLMQQRGTQALATDLLPLLPRLMSVVSNANALRSTVWDCFVGSRQGLLETLREVRALPTLDIDALIKPDWITVSHNNGPERPLLEVREALNLAVSRGEPGRWSIRGRNTAGKSMTLLELKEAAANAPSRSAEIAAGAFLLPAKSALSFAFQTGSSGETGLAHVRESLSRGPQVVMFDECAAHLDEHNLAETERLLNAAAQARTIVDIRHR